MKTKFYTFYQNNSGGRMIENKEAGIGSYVIIEATSALHANKIAEESGFVYFDGVRNEIDCDCCGDRWDRVFDDDGNIEPEIFGKPIKNYSSVYVHRLTPSTS